MLVPRDDGERATLSFNAAWPLPLLSAPDASTAIVLFASSRSVTSASPSNSSLTGPSRMATVPWY